MALQPRERQLAIAVAGLLLLVATRSGYSRIDAAFQRRQTQLQSLNQSIADGRLREAQIQQAAEQLAQWETRSLPADRELAQSLYQNWLLGVVDRLKLSQVHVDPGRPTSSRNDFTRLPFTVRGRGSLEQITRFLFEFYSVNHLHQLRDLTLKPLDNSSELELSARIEALILPGAESRNRLNDEPGTGLAQRDVKEYVRILGGRNMFAPYVPPPPPKPLAATPPPPKPKPTFDPAKFAVLTGVTEIDGRPQAWIRVKTSGQLLKVSEGDAVDVGQFRGVVAGIASTHVDLHVEGKPAVRLSLGKSLDQAAAAGLE